MPASAGRRPEFTYLDGIRGAAALIVVLYHALLMTGHTGDPARDMPLWFGVVVQGYLGVPIFIVLSGYVLMLPVAGTPGLRFRNGIWGFVKRRGRRILPPYWAALAIAVVLFATVPLLQVSHRTGWDSNLPVTPLDVVSHVLLLQDVNPSWFETIDGPLWSVAIEWQIYFVMAFALLPLWRRIPARWIVAVLLVFAVASSVSGSAAFLHPWFIALFAAGMWAAQLTVSTTRPVLLKTAAVAGVVAIPVSYGLGFVLHLHNYGLTEIAVGIALAAVLVLAGRFTLSHGTAPGLLRPFASRPMMFLGLISYSVYLLHVPLLATANLLLLPLGLSTVPQYLVMTLVVAPVVLALCWVFFLLVERHFLNSRQRHASEELERHRETGAADSVPSPAMDA
jgi:peptidoglycan/LPS O-acetylase OafA/YrhL